MHCLPRLAVGSLQPCAEPQGILWALMDALARAGLQVQTFLSRACFSPHHHHVASTVTGLCARHLDSWLMSPAVCRELFLRGAKPANLSIVEGCYDPADGSDALGGRLTPLCEWLDLPRLVAVDASQLAANRLPKPPSRVEGILIDGARDRRHLMQVATELESLWDAPVLAGLVPPPGLRARLDSAADNENESPSRERLHRLGDAVTWFCEPARLLEIACRRRIPRHWLRGVPQARLGRSIRVAIAYDEAFHSYFPDTLDLLELRGATVVDFSPLRDEALPPEIDIVYFGCGHPERHAAMLADNHCMKAALRSHLLAGRRIYGEGGGAAYLCQHLETPSGELKRMVGILPAVARLVARQAAARPAEISLARPNWLGEKGSRLRGYHAPHWRFDPLERTPPLVVEPEHQYDLIGNFQAVGSLLHFDFGADPRRLDHFFFPEVPDANHAGLQGLGGPAW